MSEETTEAKREHKMGQRTGYETDGTHYWLAPIAEAETALLRADSELTEKGSEIASLQATVEEQSRPLAKLLDILKAREEGKRVMLEGRLVEVEQERDTYYNQLEQERLKVREIHHATEGEFWYWQGDEYDHPESLGCPVLMEPDHVREFVAAKARLAEVEAECERRKLALMRKEDQLQTELQRAERAEAACVEMKKALQAAAEYLGAIVTDPETDDLIDAALSLDVGEAHMKETTRLKTALRFYADERNWEQTSEGCEAGLMLYMDGGWLARDALQEVSNDRA